MERLRRCRICLTQDERRLRPIINTHLQEIYEDLNKMPLETDDERPLMACYICCALLNNSYQLRKRCLQSEELFKQKLRGNVPAASFNRAELNNFFIVEAVSLRLGDSLTEDGNFELVLVDMDEVEIKQEYEGTNTNVLKIDDNTDTAEYKAHDLQVTRDDDDDFENTPELGNDLEEQHKDDEAYGSEPGVSPRKDTPGVPNTPVLLEMDDIYINSFKTSRGGVKLNWNGFIYEKNRVTIEKQYWVCELRCSEKYQCKSRITTTYDENKQMHKLFNTSNNEHSHDPNPLKEKIHNTINKLKNDALNNMQKKPIHIIEQCVASTSSTVLHGLPSNLNLRQIIYRQRHKLDKLKEPDSIDFEINRDYLNMNEDEDILIDKRFNENNRIIIYTSKTLLKLLCSSIYLIMDGTFKIAPTIFKQIYTIHGCVNSDTFPMVITLCTNKDKITYDKLFSSLIEYCESLNMTLSPKFILMDFEKGSQLSAKTVFVNTIIKGCYFHLSQIIYNQVQSTGFQKLYGTDESFSSEIKGILALAHLSAKDIPVYFDEWIKHISSNALIIADWFNENYISGTFSSPPKYDPNIWSTSELNEHKIPRTQNSVESWHNRFQNLIGQHYSGFYFLSKKILLEIKHQTAKIEKHQIGNPPAIKKRKYSNKSDRIETLLKNKSEYSNKSDFLKALASNINID